MKQFFFSIIALSCQLLPAQNIINGAFESATPEHWKPDGSGFETSLAEDAINGGTFVLKVKNTGGTFYSLSQTTEREEKQHLEKLVLSGYIKTEGVSAGMARLWFRATDKEGRRLTFVDYKPTITTGTTGWHKVAMTISVPAPATSFTYGVVLIGPGTAWFDSLSLEKLESAPKVRSARALKFLDTAFGIISSKSIRKDSLDMPSLRTLMYAVAEEAQTAQDCHEAISCVLANLGDHHSFLQEKHDVKAYASANPGITMPSGKLMGSIAYLKVPAFMSVNDKLADQYAQTLKKLIIEFDKDATGWVVDLRQNTGGNSAPMLLGVAPLFGEGFASGGLNALGTKDIVTYKEGGLYENNKRYRKIKNPYILQKPNPKVAVLTDGMCGSSGEVVAMAFRNAANSRSFGQPTFGNTTGNTDFMLSDGSCIYLATHLGIDRLGNVYDYKIDPEVAIADNPERDGDEVMEAAVAWLERQ